MAELLPDAPGDIDARHVVDREDAHRHPEVGQRAVDLLGGRALLDQELRFVHVRKHHPVADEAAAVPDDDRDLADTLAERQRRGQHVGRRLRAANDFEQPHDVRGAEEVQADDVLRPPGDAGERVDVERGRVAGEDRAGLGDGIELAKDVRLQLEALEDGFDDEIGRGDAVVGRARARCARAVRRPLQASAVRA